MSPATVRRWPAAEDIHRVVLSRLLKTSYEHAPGQRTRSARGQFTRPSGLSFVVSALYGECCVGIACSFQSRLSTNGGGQHQKNAEFILDKACRTTKRIHQTLRVPRATGTPSLPDTMQSAKLFRANSICCKFVVGQRCARPHPTTFRIASYGSGRVGEKDDEFRSSSKAPRSFAASSCRWQPCCR